MYFFSGVDWQRPKQGLRDIKNAGYNEIVLNIGSYISSYSVVHDTVEKERKIAAFAGLFSVLSDIGLNVKSFYVPALDSKELLEKMNSEAEVFELNRRIVCDTIAAAEEKGIDTVILEPIFIGEKSEIGAKNQDYLRDIIKAIDKRNIRVLLVNKALWEEGRWLRNTFTDEYELTALIDRLNEEAGRPLFKLCFDVGYANLCGVYMDVVLKAMESRLGMVLIRENDGDRNTSFQPFTDASAMDYLSFFRGMRAIDFAVDICMNCEGTIYGYSPLLRPQALSLSKSVADFFEWQIQLEKSIDKYEAIVLFGAGNMCRAFMKCYGDRCKVLFTCDNNKVLWGTVFEGLEIHAPEELKKLPKGVGIFICNIYYREIEAQLREMGITDIEYFNDEYMPSFHMDRIVRIDGTTEVKKEV